MLYKVLNYVKQPNVYYNGRGSIAELYLLEIGKAMCKHASPRHASIGSVETIQIPMKLTDEASRLEQLLQRSSQAFRWCPLYGHMDDAGADLRTVRDFTLAPSERTYIWTGIQLQLPPGTYGDICPRSSLAGKEGLAVIGPFVVDSGFRGEIGIPMINLSSTAIHHIAGDRIAQLVIKTYKRGVFYVVDKLSPSGRGASGYGSTGLR